MLLIRRVLSQTGLLGIFWLLWILAAGLSWRFLPTTLSQVGLGLFIAYSIFSSYRGNFQLVALINLVYLAVLVNYLVAQQLLSYTNSTIIFGITLFSLGLIYEQLEKKKPAQEQVLFWGFIALISAQCYGFFNYWSISLFNRSLLLLVVFYIIWHYLEISDGSTKSLIGHFIFSALIAIVILGGIIWANFPQVLPF